MPFDINEMRSKLPGGGARPSQFMVSMSILGSEASFLIKAASLPATTLDQIQVPYFGRFIKVAGDRNYPEWSFTVINDENFRIRRLLEQWSKDINRFKENVRAVGTSPESYVEDAEVWQYSKVGGAPIHRYKFYNMWPVEIAAIPLSWETQNTIEEFDVTFAYDWWDFLS